MRTGLVAHPDERRGPKSTVLQANRTVNHSAKLATGNGVIHGYAGVPAVDARAQIIVVAQAHVTDSELELLVPIVDALARVLVSDALVTADAGHHSEAACQVLEVRAIHALLADNAMRQRDDQCAITGHVCCTRIDTPDCRAQYGRRFATVEPVFANLQQNKRLTHFTLRGRTKVDAQSQLFCLVPYIEKLAHLRYAAYDGAVRAGVTLRLQRHIRTFPDQEHSRQHRHRGDSSQHDGFASAAHTPLLFYSFNYAKPAAGRPHVTSRLRRTPLLRSHPVTFPVPPRGTRALCADQSASS